VWEHRFEQLEQHLRDIQQPPKEKETPS
jgi:hypothetical protein